MLLDEFDQKILEELENNARISVQQIARNVGMKRTTAGYRLNKLISNGVLNFACIANVEILEYQIPLGIGINVSPGKTDIVARQLADLSNVKVLNLVAGRYSIFAWCLLKNQKELKRFFSEDLGQIQDITTIETVFAFTWVRESWRYFTLPPELSVTPNGYHPTELDLAIIKALQEDPRQSITNLAQAVECSKPVAKDRLNTLINNGIVRLVSMVNPAALGYQIEVMILIKSLPNQAFVVADQLSMHNFVRHVSLTTGNWQIFVSAQFWDSSHMRKFLSEILTASPGVTDYEIIQIMKTLKLSMNFVNVG